MGKLVYMFASLAERTVGDVTCLEGMTLLAETLHPHGIPITWMVSPESARLAADSLKQWHEDYGDEVAMTLPTIASGDSNSRAPLPSSGCEAKRKLIKKRRESLLKILPWAEVTIAGAGHTDPDAAAILEELGFEGLWGYCPEQIEVDDITDRGCPWGLFYIDPAQRLRPKPSGRGIIGMEWTARDLGKSIHSGHPSIYSTDPNDVARTGLCRWEDIDYWEGLADNYLHNAHLNDLVFLLQHQEAHEMQVEPFHCYTREDIREAAVMLDRFAEYLVPHCEVMTLSQAAKLYRQRYTLTAPSYILWEDIPSRAPNPDYGWSVPLGPWPKTFMTYDTGAMMAFIEGKVEPHILRNYANDPTQQRYFNEAEIPVSRLIHNTRYHWSREIELVVQSPKTMPYGMALWGEYALFRIGDTTGLVDHKIIPGELLYLRVDLHPGENRFKVKLAGK